MDGEIACNQRCNIAGDLPRVLSVFQDPPGTLYRTGLRLAAGSHCFFDQRNLHHDLFPYAGRTLTMPEKSLSEPRIPEFTLRPWSLWAGFAWGFAEATLFFIVPDLLLTFIALYSFRRSVKVLAFILLGALVGGTLMFCAGQRSQHDADQHTG